MIDKIIFLAHALPTATIKTCEETNGMLYCFSQWAYTVTNGTFWFFMLLAFSIAIGVASSRLGTTRAFGFASFVGMMGAIWFAVMQLMAWWVASGFILVGVIGLASMILSEK